MSNESRIKELIALHRMRPHPEGCFFAEVFRSENKVDPQDDRPTRSAVTAILFLMPEGDISRFHRVRSDEVWSHLEGAPVRQISLSPDLDQMNGFELSASKDGQPLRVIPADWWQASVSMGSFSLVSCTVGPGFDFDDFEMACNSPSGSAIIAKYPHLAQFV
ncbi:MAG: cupin domain-containing protein [Rhodothermales bacterium]|nr:cupin domain-containing protein [Rhodothermales bacterium]MDG2015582.1 cupin domain-containing protein [Rhodothermales bacterium]